MCEMLANHHFMVRNYLDATITFEKVIARTGASKSIRKKLSFAMSDFFKWKKPLMNSLAS